MSKKPMQTQAHFSITINGFHTEIITEAFSDRIVIIITQLGKPGTFISAVKESSQQSTEDIFETKVIFGKRESEINDIVSRLIVNEISKTSPKPLLLSLAFDSKFEAEAQKNGLKSYLTPIIDSLLDQGRVW